MQCDLVACVGSVAKCYVVKVAVEISTQPEALLIFDNMQNLLRLPRKAPIKPSKCSEIGELCTFRLQNVLRATTAFAFSTFQLPKVVRT